MLTVKRTSTQIGKLNAMVLVRSLTCVV